MYIGVDRDKGAKGGGESIVFPPKNITISILTCYILIPIYPYYFSCIMEHNPSTSDGIRRP